VFTTVTQPSQPLIRHSTLSVAMSTMNSASQRHISRDARSSPAMVSTISFMPYCTPTEQAAAETISRSRPPKAAGRRRT